MLSPKLQFLIAELQSLSPMPDDDTLNSLPLENHPLEKLDSIVTELKQETQQNYPIELIPPLLEVFGVDTGNGVFWRVLNLIETYPHMEEVYPLVQQATISASPGTRAWSCYLLGRRRAREDEPIFVARFQDTVASARDQALRGMVMVSQRSTMRHLLPIVEPLLHDEVEEVCQSAACAIEMLKMSIIHEKADRSSQLQFLIAKLQSLSPMPDDDTLNRLPLENHPLNKLEAILTMIEWTMPEDYPIALIPPLLEAFGVGNGKAVFWRMLKLIEKHPHLEEMYPLIQQATTSVNAGTRAWSSRLLEQRQAKEDEPYFVAKLQDSVAAVRRNALEGLIKVSRRHNMPYLLPVIEPLLHDEDREVRKSATRVMSVLKIVIPDDVDS